MKLRPFSDHERGMFVSVAGPSGTGKSTIVHETVTGHALACLYAADRYQHVETGIRPPI